jgi:signal transduction histidine kinase
MNTMPWVIAFTQPEDVFLKEVETQTNVNTITVSVISLLVIIAAIIASANLTYPITRLTKVTNQFARGNLKARASINRDDELGMLANAFNDTADILQKLIAELETKNAELERFTYTVSHDLKSPLITIRGFLGYIKDDATRGDLQRLDNDMGRVVDATEKMQIMIADLLELSRIGRLINSPKNVPFKSIVEEAIALTTGQINESHILVTFSENLPTLYCDQPRLVEVLQNLIDNAIKFSKQAPAPHIEIGEQGVDKEGNAILFVRDNGIGIDPKFHQRVFELFNKLDTNSEGTGIGLAFIKRIVEVHGGKIWVESAGQNKGSTFYFTIPPAKASTQE